MEQRRRRDGQPQGQNRPAERRRKPNPENRPRRAPEDRAAKAPEERTRRTPEERARNAAGSRPRRNPEERARKSSEARRRNPEAEPRRNPDGTPRRRTRPAPKSNWYTRLKKYPVPNWVFLPAMGLFLELILYLWSMDEFLFSRFVTVLVFGLGLGFVLGLIASLFPPKISKWVNVGFAFILVFIYMAEFFIDDAFTNFMAPGTVLAGGEGVATNYLDVVLSVLVRSIWRILLVLAPLVLYTLFAEPVSSDWKQRGLIALDGVLLYVVAFGIIYAAEVDVMKMNLAYNFDTAVRSFGLHMALVLDTTQNSSLMNNELDFAVPGSDEYQQTEATLPQGIINPDKPVEVKPHTLGLDFTALAESESDNNIKSLHEYVASQTPANTNAYTGLFKGKNLIFITAEAFCGAIVDPELTPTMYRLIHKGIYFSDYYQPGWGAGTIGGEYSNVTGMMPVNGQCMQEANQQDLFLTMGKQLQKEGYVSGAFHNNDYTYYSRHTTHTHLGYDIYMGWGNGMEKALTRYWPQSDLEMMEYIIPMYVNQDQPFSLYFMSVSGHSNYGVNSNAMSKKNYEYVKDLPYSEQVKCYIAANLELEFALTYIVEQLEAAGIADDTVIVMSADHYPYGLEKSNTWGNEETYLNELFGQECDSEFVRDQNSLILWSGCLEDSNIQVDAPTYSLDILPTLSNLFGVEYDSRLMVGRDVFSGEEAIIFFGGAGSWKTEMGTYSSRNGKFTPAEGVEVDNDYVKRINAIVRNKIVFCKGVAKYDYFNYVSKALENVKE